MIHPDTCLRWISHDIGHGIFATAPIPAGTITYIQDDLDIVIPPHSPLLSQEAYRDHIERYTFLDSEGNRILSWDHAKFMNHCCFPNTITTGYGFEIALRDIEPGEEVTDDYGVFTTSHQMTINCSKVDCRKEISCQDFDRMVPLWDRWIKEALAYFKNVNQPLQPFLQNPVKEDLESYLATGQHYRSIAEQKPPQEPSFMPSMCGSFGAPQAR